MSVAAVTAPAKVNLALHVLGRRGDGYHEVETLIAFAGVADAVDLEFGSGPDLSVCGPFAADLAGLPPERNLCMMAAERFAARFGGGPWRIALEKWLPPAAGLGGGSADAAAVLRLLADAVGVSHDDPGVVDIARGLGADVPACLAGRPCIARGIGELLEPLARFPEVPVLLANPRIALPTAAVFRAWTQEAPPARLDRVGIEAARDAAGLAQVLTDSRNMLQTAAIALEPAVAVVLDALEASAGCLLARMSGSGATCFGLFATDADCAAAAERLRAAHPGWWVSATRLRP